MKIKIGKLPKLAEFKDGLERMNSLAWLYEEWFKSNRDEWQTVFEMIHTLHGAAAHFKHARALKILKQLCAVVDKTI